MLRISESGNRVRTCGPDKSSKNARKMQINIKICDFFYPSQKVGGTSDILSPTAKGAGDMSPPPPPPPPPPPHYAHVYNS